MKKLVNNIVCGDCIEILGKAREPFADLVFADPPFNIGYKYDKYYDKVKSKNYIAWTKEWMSACKGVLKPGGSFYIAIGDDYAANVKVIADELGLVMRNWIIWHYTFGQQTKRMFARAHTHIFYFVNDAKNFTFNDYAVRVPSDRQLIYNDKRANPIGKLPDDVWNTYPRVCGTFKERTCWHPCQMPESLLKRIIRVSSNVGDCVLDPFSGSGTTAAASFQLGRVYAGTDISEKYVKEAKRRLAGLARSKGGGTLGNWQELSEMKQLLTDMGMSWKEVASNNQTLGIFTNQFNLRMNNGKKYEPGTVLGALEGLGC